MDMTATLTIIGMILTVVLSIGGSLGSVLMYVSKFMGKSETQEKHTVNDIKEIKESINHIYELIRSGALHPICTQAGEIMSMKTQFEVTRTALLKLEDEVHHFHEKYGWKFENTMGKQT